MVDAGLFGDDALRILGVGDPGLRGRQADIGDGDAVRGAFVGEGDLGARGRELGAGELPAERAAQGQSRHRQRAARSEKRPDRFRRADHAVTSA